MRKLRTVLAPLAAFSLVLAACGGDDDDTADDADTAVSEDTADTADTGGEATADTATADTATADTATADTATADTATADTVDASQGTDLTFHMITHSDDGPFWSVVKRGMEAACRGSRRHRACGCRRSTIPAFRCS